MGARVFAIEKYLPKIIKFMMKILSYNRKSCCQQGFAPLTVTVVHLTFWSFNVAYVLNCDAKTNQIYIKYTNFLYGTMNNSVHAIHTCSEIIYTQRRDTIFVYDTRFNIK